MTVFSLLMTYAPARRLLRPPLLAFLAAALAASVVSGCGSGGTPAAAGVISFNTNSCGVGWTHPAAGLQTLRLYNGATAGAEVDLIDPATGAVYAEADDIGPGTSAPIQVDLGSGRYAFRCLVEDNDAITGPTVRIGGHVKGDRAVAPVTSDDLIEPAQRYQGYVTAGLQTLSGQVKGLDAAVLKGDLAAARRAWLPAHLTYERLGAAYGTFGAFDDEIDSNANGLVGGVASPKFSGFYRLEYGLWHGQRAKELAGPASALLREVLSLQRAWPSMEVSLLDIGLRTHEILENALEFQLSGHDDYGSGTTLATTQANITGTLELLSILHPLLVTRYAALPAVYTWLDRLNALLEAAKTPSGQWMPAAQLTAGSREQIDSACSQALEELAPIAAITEPRVT